MSRIVAIAISSVSVVVGLSYFLLLALFNLVLGTRMLLHPMYSSFGSPNLTAVAVLLIGCFYSYILYLYLKGLRIRYFLIRIGQIPVTGIPLASAIYALTFLVAAEGYIRGFMQLYTHFLSQNRYMLMVYGLYIALFLLLLLLLSRLSLKLFALPEFNPNIRLASLCIGLYSFIIIISPLRIQPEGWILNWMLNVIWVCAFLTLSINMFYKKQVNKKLVFISAFLWALIKLLGMARSWIRPGYEFTAFRIFSSTITVSSMILILLVASSLMLGKKWIGKTMLLASLAVFLYAARDVISWFPSFQVNMRYYSIYWSYFTDVLNGKNPHKWIIYSHSSINFGLISLAASIALIGLALALYRIERAKPF